MDRNARPDPRRRKPTPAPKPANDDERLDEALEESFPASDPPAPAHPDITGWDREDEDSAGKRRP